MKRLFFLSSIFLFSISADKCNEKKTADGEYKAKLETKALCMNYTLTLQEGNLDTSFVNASWTDETTNKTYKNAFGLVNPCDFPASIKEGDEFWFVIDSTRGKDCAVCLAYYPTPPKKIWVKVITK
ncbi:MAG: hypothetical protein WDN26_02410 [Chitinophagaceae bacterium]